MTGLERNGIGFLVENLLGDFNHENGVDDEINKCKREDTERRECNDVDKKYDEIKQSILQVYKKINQRKTYNHKTNVKKIDAFSYMNYSKVKEQYRELLKLLYAETEKEKNRYRAKWHITMLYRLLGYTRDISEGMGERELAYMQIFELARYDGGAASCAVKTIVLSSQSSQLGKSPLGSWKDVKGLVAYMRRTMNMRDERDMAAYIELTNYMVNMVNERRAKDVLAFYKDDTDNEGVGNGFVSDEQVSFVSKWIPRENKSKKYGNFYERLACDYYKDWLPKHRNANPVSYEKAVIKCKINYRKLVSLLNQYLETPQVKMCQERWSEIAFSKTTRLTRDLQNRALLNLKPDEPSKRHIQNVDREACAETYKVWKCSMINHELGIKTDLETHVRVAEYYGSSSLFAVNKNAEWAAFVSQEALKSRRLSRVIPVLAGTSYKAIGLALAVAENAATGKTLILNDDGEELVLHDLDASFVKNVKCLRNKPQRRSARSHSVHSHPMYKCLISALKLFVESNVEAKQTRHPEHNDGFTVTIFTDDDSSDFFNDDVCFKEVWNEASILYREFGYGVPNVVLWGMASTVCGDNNDYVRETVAYNSVSYGGALTIRVGCEPNDICKYLEVDVKTKPKHNEDCIRRLKLNNELQCERHKNDWQNEWNNLIEILYCKRYYNFEKYFW